ncbi:MAG: TonB-dependent receptor [Gemmatimonadales bacterium]|nr:TonB-dependent receptor [Gemmatimonadales bacterium]
MMSFRPACVAGLALWLAWVPALQAQQQPTPQWRTLRGTVEAIGGPDGVAGAVVRVGARASVTTDEHGHFAVTRLPAGRHEVIVTAIGFAPVTDTVDLRASDREIVVRMRPVVVELQELQATAEAAPPPAGQTSTVLDADELARRRGQTIGEALEDLPGIAVIQYGPSIAKPVVRGLHSQRIQVMNGQVPQEGQQWGAEHAPEIDGFAANEVEVIRGAAGVLYGSSAIGGVVRVVPRPLPTTHGVSGELQVNAFSNNRQGATSLRLEGAGVSVPLLSDLSFRVQGTLRNAGDARTPGYYLPNTGFTETDWNAAVGLHRPWGTSQVSFSHFGTTLGMYAGAHIGTVEDLERAMADPIVADAFAREITRPEQRVSHSLFTVQNQVILGPATSLDVTYGYQYNNRNEFDSRGFAATSPRPAFALRLITHSLEAKLHHAPLRDVTGTIGVIGLRQGNLSPGRSFLIPQYRMYNGAVYALEQWQPGRLSLSAGLRYDTRWQRAYQYGAPVIISPEDTRTWGGLSGSLGATWQWDDHWSIGGSLGRMWRPANVNERFSQGVHHGSAQYEIGDSALDRERTLALDATLRHVSDRVRLEATIYRNTIDGFIYLRPRAPVQTVRGAYPAFQYTAANALMTGGEVSAQWNASSHLILYASGTLVRGTDRGDDTPLFDMPADRMVATVRVHGAGTGRIAAPYLELGTTLVRQQDRVPPATVYTLPTDGYALLNLEVGAGALRLLGHDVEVGLTARNLLDTAYRDYLSRYRLFVDDPGRDLVLRLRTTFGHAPL